jgi:3D (Asp-Asp-Asp) domain-containing protein
MKYFISILTLSALFTPSIFAEQSMLARVTVYWARGGKGSDHYTRQHKSSTGARLRTGHCAVDPKKIPYGSKVVLNDGTALAAVDTGSAVRSRRAARLSGRTGSERSALVVDRFFETKREALSWANTHPAFMSVRVALPEYRNVPSKNVQLGAARVVPTSTAVANAQPKSNLKLATPGGVVRSPFNKLGR